MEWKPLETAPYKRTIVVARHNWEGVVTVNWENCFAASRDLSNWTDPPTHWLDGLALPSPPVSRGE